MPSDTTERKRAEEALREREAWLAGQREALEAALNDAPLQTSLGVLVRTATGRLGHGVRAAFYLADAEGTALRHVVGMPDAYAEAIDGFQIGPESLACGLATHTGLPVLTGDVSEEPRWAPWLWLAEKFEYRGCWSFPIPTTAGKFVATFAVYWPQPREAAPRDLELAALVTQAAAVIISRHIDAEVRRRAEDALRRSEERFRALTSATSDVVYCMSRDWTEMRHLRGREIIADTLEPSRTWLDKYIHPDDQQRVMEAIRRAIESKSVFELEHRVIRVDGSLGWTYSRAIPILDEQGEITEWFGAASDVTERKQSECERERLLERERAARVVAEDANRLKDEFLATVSHELRTPLNAMLGWSRMLLSGRLDEERRAKGIEVIERNVRVQAQLVEDLLDVSRIISGKMRLDVRRVELEPVVESAVDAVRPAADAKGIRIDTSYDAGVRDLAGDSERIQQMAWNLLSNAVKFTPTGGRVRVSLTSVDSRVDLSVADTGEGIDPEFLPYVFDRFQQADATTARRHGGLGLGLAIVRHLAEMHGGSVRVASDGRGKGSVFTVTFPVAAEATTHEAGDHAPPGVDVPRSGEPVTTLAGVRVLVVDDDPEARDLVAVVLGGRDAEVRSAGSAAEGLAELVRWRPDVLVSDIGMPDEDGYALIARVRALPDEQGGRIPAVALTAYARAKDRLNVLTAGYQMHLPKPADPAELVAVVASLAGRITGNPTRA